MDFVISGFILFLPALLYAVGGAIQGNNEGETFDAIAFVKTLVVGALSAGLISQTQADEITQLGTSTIVMVIIDKLANALLRRLKRTASLAQPPPAVAPPSAG